MLRAVEAIVDEKGHVRLSEKIHIQGIHRAVLTILDETIEENNITAFLSEQALAKDWNRPEEEEAWKDL
jgi:hypothetical protein